MTDDRITPPFTRPALTPSRRGPVGWTASTIGRPCSRWRSSNYSPSRG